MATINTTDPKPGFVYDQVADTWYPILGVAPASELSRWAKTVSGGQTSVSGLDDYGNTLSYEPGLEQVFLNGVQLVRSADYTASTGNSITGFSPALAANDVVVVIGLTGSLIEKTNAILVTQMNAKGDLLVGSAADAVGTLTAATTNGYVLYTNSATATGLEWAAAPVSYSAPTIGSTAITSGATVTTIAGLTLTSPTINTGTLSSPVFTAPEETVNVTGTAFATGTNNIDTSTAGVWFFNSNATANGTLNFRASSGATLNSILGVGQSITIGVLIQNGSTAYYPTTFQIDGNAVTPRWQGGSAPTAGNASSTDIYAFNIIKTAATPTYSVFASQTKFA